MHQIFCLTHYARLIVALALLVSATGCTTTTQRYSPNVANVVGLRELHTTQKIRVADFSGEDKRAGCRAAGIAPPDDVTFAAYIANALRDDLRLADAYAEQSNFKITGKLVRVDLSCAVVGKGNWTFQVAITLPNGESFEVNKVYEFDGNYLGDIVYTRAKDAFIPAVQELVKSITSHPMFRSVLTQS
jgi:hypothetical protein